MRWPPTNSGRIRGFRPDSPNYCAGEAIATCIEAFVGEPVELTADGLLRPRMLNALSGRELSQALPSYVSRAQRGSVDSVLFVGTDKDLMEAVAAHVLTERFGSYSERDNLPTLLGPASAALGLEPNLNNSEHGGLDGARPNFNTRLCDLGIVVNRLRNRAGSAHARPFVPSLSEAEARAATEAPVWFRDGCSLSSDDEPPLGRHLSGVQARSSHAGCGLGTNQHAAGLTLIRQIPTTANGMPDFKLAVGLARLS